MKLQKYCSIALIILILLTRLSMQALHVRLMYIVIIHVIKFLPRTITISPTQYDREYKKTDIFMITLNKSEKAYSPSTMYNDYSMNEYLFHWQSQSQDREKSPKIQRYIHHKEEKTCVSLFVREFKNNGAYTSPYIFLGNADYVSHEGERPVSFNWKLHEPLPAGLLAKANKTIAV